MARHGDVRFGLPASRRIRKRREFLAVRDVGSRIGLSHLVLLIAARADDKPARIGITVTRRFGGAVTRNRAKRLIREAFRLSPQLVPDGIDLVVIPKAAASLSDLGTVLGELRRAAPMLRAKAPALRAGLAKSQNSTQTARTPRKRPPT